MLSLVFYYDLTFPFVYISFLCQVVPIKALWNVLTAELQSNTLGRKLINYWLCRQVSTQKAVDYWIKMANEAVSQIITTVQVKTENAGFKTSMWSICCMSVKQKQLNDDKIPFSNTFDLKWFFDLVRRNQPDKSLYEAERSVSFAFADEQIVELIVIHYFLHASELTSLSHVECGPSEKNQIIPLLLITTKVNTKGDKLHTLSVHVEIMCLPHGNPSITLGLNEWSVPANCHSNASKSNTLPQ